ncbi:hypothetical protein BGZ83_005019, partial [Gryganskiella cystojenkinii]
PLTEGGVDGVNTEQGGAPNYDTDRSLVDGVLYQGGRTAGEVGAQVLPVPMINGGLAGADDATGIH